MISAIGLSTDTGWNQQTGNTWMGGYLASRLLKHYSQTFDRVTDSLIFNMDCVSNGLGGTWFPVTSYTWKCLVCWAHQRLLFQHIHKFLLCRDVRPRKRSLFHCPPSRVSLVSTDIISTVRGKFDFYKELLGFWSISDPENHRFWIYQHLGRTARFERRTGGYLTNSNGFCEPWVIHLISGYLIFLRIVMMNLQIRHDTQQGFVPAQQWSTSLVSHRSSQDSLPRHHRYIYLQIGRGANLQDWPTTKVEIIRNRLLKLVASTLLIIHDVDSHISNPWSHAQLTHVVQGHGPRIVSCKISTLCLSRWIQHFCAATQFSSS